VLFRMAHSPLAGIPGHHSRVFGAVIICMAWTLIALAWTPPTMVVEQLAPDHTLPASMRMFAFVLASFVPWMAFTPMILRLNRRFAVSQHRLVQPLLINLLAGVVLVPVITTTGRLFSTLLVQEGMASPIGHGFLRDVLVTSLYAIPTYIAVLSIGQALAYLERDRARERALADARLQALQAQINPHFLFNTLNAISTLGYRDPELAASSLSQLSDLLRLSLQERPAEIVLKEEIAFARGYLDLYALLMQERLVVEYDIDDRVWNALVPVMLLQPLIENALLHGVAHRNAGGRIVLSAREQNGQVALSIVNDGPTADPPSTGFGIGLSNTRERLHALYGEANIELSKDETGCTSVTVLLPKRIADRLS
jgi:two-component system sensor histidine kinase AlgZ